MQESPSELPISVSSSPAGINRLPLETFHRIFRLLPPRTFYATVPLVCRAFRAATVNAIPGCPGGNTVAIDCSVTLSFDPPDDSDFDAVQYADVERRISCEFFCPVEFSLVAAEAEAENNVAWTSFRATVFVYPRTSFGDDGVNLRELLSSFVTENAPLHFIGLLGRSGIVFNVANISQVTLVGRDLCQEVDITFKYKTFRGRTSRQTALVSPKVLAGEVCIKNEAIRVPDGWTEDTAKKDCTDEWRRTIGIGDDDRSSNLLSAPRRKLQRKSQE
ncbi:hypothetical protein M427DRAFT_43707 [Gonapodya prolifera JEL478]|uniref:F-box domain-containing protein n=1 Tax=Gonapodya prolifera (strain JEL478) TaxID=1344416 RepID=A0A139AHI4_GONPJ|nr:hypothetical protein M427DRAFT_43707 [Gonapodya prolifera JEL478]|eukprot:KXS16220.1 hypothetical protein M427DRAFT_43707 [Gonapodya prolifera JEL478]